MVINDGIIYRYNIPGWWYTYPMKNHGVSSSWDDEIPNIWKNKKCSKPPNHICHSYWISWILNRYLCIISHSYWSYVHQLSYRLGAPHCSDINCIVISWTKENVKWLCWRKRFESIADSLVLEQMHSKGIARSIVHRLNLYLSTKTHNMI